MVIRLAIAVAFLAAATPASSQTTAADTAAVPAAAGSPPAFEVVTRARQLSDSATHAERAVARLAATTAIEADLSAAVRRHGELQALLASLVETDYARPERLSRIRDQALLEDQRLDALRGRTLERLEQLGELRGEWTARQRFWRDWQAALRQDPDYPLVAEDITRVAGRIAGVVDSASAALTGLLALQRRVEELRAGNEEIAASVTALRAGGRASLLRRTEPLLLSAPHRAQLSAADRPRWSPGDVVPVDAYVSFVRENTGLLAFYVVFAFLVGALARRLRPVARPERGWSGMLDHPWALGVFASTTIAIQRIILAPPLWDFLLWTLFSASAALLAARLFAVRALRLTVYLLAATYPVFLLLEALRLPTPTLRLVVAALAATVLPVFVFLARRRTVAAAAASSRDPRRIWPLRIGAGLWAVVLLATWLGFDTLGRWVLHATVTSAAVVFVVVLLVAVLRGSISTLLRVEGRGRFRVLRRVGVPLAHRIMQLLQVLLIFGAILVLLDVWEVAQSPVAMWRLIIDAGFTVGSTRITVGRLLLGALVLYLASLTSWVLRTAGQADVYRRWHLDRGVGESINRLLHYLLITIGFLTALAILGVQLQNFAIVAGALGIGIGFGLQNVVNNFVSGLILLFERPVRVGDTVVVDGEWGTIRKIGLRSTVMLTFDQSEMIVPNADLVSEKVTNWTLSSPIARLILPVGVAYGSRIDDVLAILRDAGTAHDAVLTDPPPQALFVGFGDSSLDFEVRVWIREIRLRLEVRSGVLADVERRLGEAGIEIPFPQRDLHVRSVDDAAADRLLGRGS
ncbi:MAG TPA: mechanosensitive ion channel domain-containing protein [Longimicrobiales bacterium]|nr:mechanosensitive ion channel domain-containing protein [Longimicrobiales bacterium]